MKDTDLLCSAEARKRPLNAPRGKMFGISLIAFLFTLFLSAPSQAFAQNNTCEVNAGADVSLSCSQSLITLHATTAVKGGIVTWSTVDGSIVSGGNTLNATVNSPGIYTVCVTNPLNGCIATDVVVVVRLNTDIKVNACEDKVLTCTNPTVKLTATASLSGCLALWTTVNGHIVSGANTLDNLVVDAPGVYLLTVTDLKTGCIGVDEVVVTRANTDVQVKACNDLSIDCAHPTATLSCTTNLTSGLINWNCQGGNILSGANTLNKVVVNAEGTYSITIKDPNTGCIGTDHVVVTKVNTNVQVSINGPSTQTLTCSNTTLNLHASVNISGGVAVWTASNGGHIVSGANTIANVVVDMPGTYTLTVTDPNTGCSGLATVVVTRVNTDVAVNVTTNRVLTCSEPTITLSGTTNVSGGLISWGCPGAGHIISGANTLDKVVVDAAGTYTLTVTDPKTGCIGVGTVIVTKVNTDVAVNVCSEQVLTCANPTVKLTAKANISGGIIAWAGGHIVSGAHTLDNVVVDAAGTYTLTVTDPKTGCNGQGVVVVTTVNTDVEVNVSTHEVLTCLNPTIKLNAKVNISGGLIAWTGGHIVSGANTLDNVVIDEPGTYTLRVTDPKTGCVGIGTTIVTRVNTDVGVDIGSCQPLSCANPTIKLSAKVNLKGGVALWTGGHIVSGANTLDNVVVDAAGTYTLTVTDPKTGCIGIGTVVVPKVNTDIAVNVCANQVLSCTNPTVKLSAKVNVAGGIVVWAGGHIVSGANTLDNVVVDAAGTYTLTVTDPKTGCIGIGVVVVTKANTDIAVNVCHTQIITCANPTVKLTATANVTGKVIAWTGGHIVSGANTLDNVVVDAAGTYTLTITDPKTGCIGIGVVTVIHGNTDIGVTMCHEQVISCANPVVKLSAKTNFTGGIIAWTGGHIVSGANTIDNVMVDAEGTYTLTIKDPKTGCIGIGTVVVVKSNTDIGVSAGVDLVISCANPTVKLNGKASITGGLVSWTASGGGHIVAGANTLENVVVDAAGTYTLTVTDPKKGCVGVDVVVVTQSNTDVAVSVCENKVLSCLHPTITLSAKVNLTNKLVTWAALDGGNIVSGANTLDSVVVNAAGTYKLTVKDPVTGCIGTGIVKVTLENTGVAVTVVKNQVLSCKTPQITLSGTTNITGAIALWTTTGGHIVSGANTLNNLVVDAAGTYILTVKDPKTGCLGLDVTVVTYLNTDISVITENKVISCLNPTVKLGAKVNIKTGKLLWTCSPGGHILSGANTLDEVVVNAEGTYTLTVTDTIKGCTGIGIVVVTRENTSVGVHAIDDKVITCGQTNIKLSATVNITGGVYLWTATHGGTIISGETTLDNVIVDGPGVYQVKVTDPKTGCIGIDEVVIKLENSNVSVDAGADLSLACGVTQLKLKAVTNIKGGVYLWKSNGGNIVSGINTIDNLTVNAAGTYIITVRDTLSGCIGIDEVVVTNGNTDVAVTTCGTQSLTCTEKKIILSAKTNITDGTYLWTATGGGLILSGANTLDNVMVSTAGTYMLTVTNPKTGCIGTGIVVVVHNNTTVSVNAGEDKIINCLNPTVTLSAKTNVHGEFLWMASGGGAILSGGNSLQAVVGTAGTYTLNVTDTKTGCSGQDVVIVTKVDAGILVDAGVDASLSCKNSQIKLKATSNDRAGVYLWTALNGGHIVSGANTADNVIVDAPGTYAVVVTDSKLGCSGSDVVIVTHSNTGVTVNAGPDKTLTCKLPQITLSGSANISGTFNWTAMNGGTIISGQNTANVVVGAVGAYMFTVSDPSGKCSGSDIAVVTGCDLSGDVNAGPDMMISCKSPQVVLSGSTSIQGGVAAWTALNGGVIISGATTIDHLVVSTPGTYVLTVVNPKTGCTGTDVAVVTGSAVDVQVQLKAEVSIGCKDKQLKLAASTNISGGIYSWRAVGTGKIISGANTIDNLLVGAAGTYILTVTDPVSGCFKEATCIVLKDNTGITVNAGPDKVLTCDALTVTLKGTTDVTNGTVLWTATEGGMILTGAGLLDSCLIAHAGKYLLTVTDPISGCSASDEVLVTRELGVGLCGLKITPNPALPGQIFVGLGGEERIANSSEEPYVQIYDVLGKLVYKQKANFLGNANVTMITLDSKFTAGTYVVKINIGGKIYSDKLIVKK